MNDFKISVIIPVYNAEKYLKEAVESAVNLDEVFEIILIEDNSPDDSLKMCEELKKKYPEKIKLYQHPDRQNHGAGATRNLGIKMAKGNYIAFLDADDFYLPDRFKNTVEILKNHPDIDGTHAILGVYFENDKLKKQFGKKYEKSTGVIGEIEPPELFETCLKQGKGWIHLNTLTVRKNLAEKVGFFDETLRISQDRHFTWKLALSGKFVGEPRDVIVAKRRVHDSNRITNEKNFFKYHKMLIPAFIKWARGYDKDIKKYLPALTMKHLRYLQDSSRIFSNKNPGLLKFLYLKELIILPFNLKKLFLKYAFNDCISFLFRKSVFMHSTYDEFLNYFKKKNLQKRINKFAEKYKNKKVIIYGAGVVFDVIAENFDLSPVNIEYVSDRRFKEPGEYKGFKAIPYQQISGQKPDIVLVTLQDIYLVKYFFEGEVFPEYGKFKYVLLEEVI